MATAQPGNCTRASPTWMGRGNCPLWSWADTSGSGFDTDNVRARGTEARLRPVAAAMPRGGWRREPASACRAPEARDPPRVPIKSPIWLLLSLESGDWGSLGFSPRPQGSWSSHEQNMSGPEPPQRHSFAPHSEPRFPSHRSRRGSPLLPGCSGAS